MSEHTFTSKLLVSNWNKNGVPRLRVSVRKRDYEFITYNGEVRYLTKMMLRRTSGEVITIDYPRISKGTSTGGYAPHYITIPAKDVIKYGYKPNEPVAVKIEW